MYAAWLTACAVADDWAARNALSGRELPNLSEFRAAQQFASLAVSSDAILRAIDAPLDDEPIELPQPLPAGRAGAAKLQISLRRLETIAPQR